MSRRKVRFVLAALVIAGGLGLMPPEAAAAGRAVQEPDAWSLAVRWVAQMWEENVVKAWETQSVAIDPDGSQAPAPPEGASSDEGWGLDPNG